MRCRIAKCGWRTLGEITRGMARGIDTHGALLVETPGRRAPVHFRRGQRAGWTVSILLVDIGNTRAKCAVLRGARLSAPRALPHRAGAAGVAALVRRAPRECRTRGRGLRHGRQVERALAAAVRARFGLRTEFIRSTRAAAGVRNGYRDTWRLGADRWVGVIAAHALARGRPALVVNIGTALTVDAVTGNGRHLGGAIVPGPNTMIESLLAGTHGIAAARRARGAPESRARVVCRGHRERARRRRRIRRGRIHRPRRWPKAGACSVAGRCCCSVEAPRRPCSPI